MSNFTSAQIKRLELIGAVDHFYTVANFQYKNNSSAKLDTEVADIYEKATGESVSRNWACGHCSYELYLKAGRLYYASKKAAAEEKPKRNGGAKAAQK